MSVADLLRDAARWRLLGRLFECPSEAWRSDIAALADEVEDDQLRASVASALAQATEGQYHSVFGPGGPAPPREASYHDTLELGSLMSELAGYYAAFGYRPRLAEPPDHVAVEVGFLAYLKLKEAYALSAGDDDRAALTREAAARFRAGHLARAAAPLAAVLADSEIDYLVTSSARLAQLAGPPPPRTRLPVIQNASDDLVGDEITCAGSE